MHPHVGTVNFGRSGGLRHSTFFLELRQSQQSILVEMSTQLTVLPLVIE